MNEIELLTAYRKEMRKIQIKNRFTDEQMTSYRLGFMDAIREYERRIATDVQPVRHGRWISQGDDMWLCSNCKENIIYSEHESDRTEKQRYCCKCGARMDGDTE